MVATNFVDKNLYGTGICIRDNNGDFFAVKTILKNGAPPIHEAKTDCKFLVDGNFLLIV